MICWALMSPVAGWAAETEGGAGAAIAREPLSAGSLVQMIAGLALVVVLIFALAWAVRRFGAVGLQGTGALRVIGGLSMGARERVVLIQVGEQQILVGVAPGRVQALHVLETPVKVGERTAGAGSFAERLRGAMGTKRP